jgi:hypothetical protein
VPLWFVHPGFHPSVIIDYTTALPLRWAYDDSSHDACVAATLVHAGVQVDEDVDGCDDNFGGDEDDDDPFEILA